MIKAPKISKSKPTCQFAEGTPEQCGNPSTCKWGDHWFCAGHGSRHGPFGAETCTKCEGDGEQATPGISCGACLGTGVAKSDLQLAERALKDAEAELEYATGRYNRAVDAHDKAFAKVEEMKWGGDHSL